MGTEQLIGVWRLVSVDARLPDGSIHHPWGEAPVGLVVLTREGYLSAQLMRPDRPVFADPANVRPEEARLALQGYAAYFGKYEIDEASRTLVTHVEGASAPNLVGGDQVRNYELRDGRLILRPPVLTIGGQSFTSEYAWERA